MSSVRLKLEGEPRSISPQALIIALDNWFKLLAEIDTAISREANGSVDWVISNLAIGSVVIEAESRSKLEDQNYAPEIIKSSIIGLRNLETEGLTPAYLTENGLNYAKKFLKLIGNRGVVGIDIANGTENAHLTARASANVDQLFKVARSSIGSVEGKLEKISVHKRPTFVVYHHRTHKAVNCLFKDEMLNEVKDALGSRVIAFGEVRLNAKNEPVTVIVDKLRLLRPNSELPSIARIGGIVPDFTGEMETVEYLRSSRG